MALIQLSQKQFTTTEETPSGLFGNHRCPVIRVHISPHFRQDTYKSLSFCDTDKCSVAVISIYII